MVKQPEIKNQYDYNLNKSSIDSFLNDILYSSKSPDFRGWVLPNGQLLSTFVAPIIINDRVRQDHGIIAKLFISGLESYDKEAYNRMKFLYDEYCKKNQDAYDIYESFAVEVLGWIQVSSFGKKELLHWENAGKIN